MKVAILTWTVVVAAFVGIKAKTDLKSLNLDPVYPGAWGLPSSHFYDEVFEITDKNHDTKVLKSDDAWIVIFFKVRMERKWRHQASVLGGSVWFGSVDVDQNPKLVEKIKLDVEKYDLEGGVAVVYPMSPDKKLEMLKKGGLRITDEPRQAELFVSSMIPDRSTNFDFSPPTLQAFNNWVVKGYYGEQPPKFPVIVLTDETETPIHVKVLSHYMRSHFIFGIVRNAAVPAMRVQFNQVPVPQVYPTYLVLLGQEPSAVQMANGNYNMKFNIMPFLEQKYGKPGHIRSLMNFLFTANDDYRDTLPGRSSAEPEDVSSMKLIRQRLSKRVKVASKEDTKKNNQNSNKAEL